MDRIQTYIQVLQGAEVPVLKKRSDIWSYFPVNSKPLGRGNNKADRHGIEWHMANLRRMSELTKQPIQTIQKALMGPLLKALGSSPYWNLLDSNNVSYVAKIAMRFDANTRKAPNGANRVNRVNKVNTTNNTRKVVHYRRWNVTPAQEPKPLPTKLQNNTRRKPVKTQAEINENAFFARLTEKTNEQKAANNATRKALMQKYIKKEPEHVRQIRQIANKLSADNQGKLIQELKAVIPTDPVAFQESMDTLVVLALDTQAYHPLFLEALFQLNTGNFPELPSDAVVHHYRVRFEKAFQDEAFLKPKTLKEKLNYRCFLLFAGYLYREGFMPFSEFKSVLDRLVALSHHEDKEIQSEAILGLEFALIRGGKRMIVQGGEDSAIFSELVDYLTQLSTTFPEARIRFQIMDFLDSVKADFTIRSADPWAVGAPSSNIRPLAPKVVVAPAVMPAAPAVPKNPGLGPDIAELWKRFPLDVVQEQKGQWSVRFHRKKLAERFEREKAKFPNQDAMVQTLTRHILNLIDTSAHWTRGPITPGTLVTVVHK